MEKSNVFRKSSLERINSPEQLNDYIKVSRPDVWLTLAAVIVLLIGVSAWGIFGSVASKQEAVAVVKDGAATCYVVAENISEISTGMEVLMGDSVGKVSAVGITPVQVDESFESYAAHTGGFEVGDWVCQVNVEIDAPDGIFAVQIVTEKIKPISFILN